MSYGENGSNGKRMRLSGRLDHGPRGLTILTDAGDLWVLEQEDVDSDLLGRLVIAEGVLVGLDRLKVDWIGQAQN